MLDIYSNKDRRDLGIRILKARSINNFVVAPEMMERDVVKYKKYFKIVNSEIFKYGDKHDYKNVIKIVKNMLVYMLSVGDVTSFNGVMLWLERIFHGYPDIRKVILPYHADFMQYIQEILNIYAIYFNKKADKLYNNKNMYIEIKKETVFYKGVNMDSRRRLLEFEKYYFLAFIPLLAMQYSIDDEDMPINDTLKQICSRFGYIGVFKAEKKMKLLNISKIESVRMLLESSKTKQMTNDINYVFEIYTEENGDKRIKRNSVTAMDKRVGELVCSMDYDGWYGPSFGGFGSEIMICNSTDVVLQDVIESRTLINFCDNIFYNNVLIQEIDDEPDIEIRKCEVEEKSEVETECGVSDIIDKCGLTDFGSIVRNKYEIFIKTDFLDNKSKNELKTMAKEVGIRVTLMDNNVQLIRKIKKKYEENSFK